MANPRVHEIASELGIDSKLAMDKLKTMGEFVKSPSSSIAPPVARRLKAALEADGVKVADKPKESPTPAASRPTPGPRRAPASPAEPAAPAASAP
ncbi:MAG: translation initiation factor IF-2 N-terminal domain-containing protein, partial [Micrococcales bacterium]|nr:translation initiation factor IF-2 N-terminal domain-containing protein [Micrococcales bacterium]